MGSADLNLITWLQRSSSPFTFWDRWLPSPICSSWRCVDTTLNPFSTLIDQKKYEACEVCYLGPMLSVTCCRASSRRRDTSLLALARRPTDAKRRLFFFSLHEWRSNGRKASIDSSRALNFYIRLPSFEYRPTAQTGSGGGALKKCISGTWADLLSYRTPYLLTTMNHSSGHKSHSADETSVNLVQTFPRRSRESKGAG